MRAIKNHAVLGAADLGENEGNSAYLESLESCSRKSNEFQAQMLPICVEALLMQIADMSDSCNAFSKQSDTPQTQLSSILFYLNQHLKDPVTLDEISDHFFISKHHLNKVFKKATGTTVIDYLFRKRIAYAQMLLFNGCTIPCNDSCEFRYADCFSRE